MTETLPPNVVQGAGLLWLLATPLLWLGAALSKMDTVDHYNVQLAIVSGICVLAVGAGLGSFSFKAYRWATSPPILSSDAIWSPIPPDQEIGREEALFRRADHRLSA